MIDLEVDVLNRCTVAIDALSESVFVTNQRYMIPTDFPCVSIVEVGNDTRGISKDSSKTEKFCVASYVVCVYTNDYKGAKAHAKSLLNTVDGVMNSINFNRVSVTNSEGVSGQDYYQITARYEAVFGSDGKIYRR